MALKWTRHKSGGYDATAPDGSKLTISKVDFYSFWSSGKSRWDLERIPVKRSYSSVQLLGRFERFSDAKKAAEVAAGTIAAKAEG